MSATTVSLIVAILGLAINSNARQLPLTEAGSEVAFVRASFGPSTPRVGEKITAFFHIERFTSPTSARVLAEASVDGAALPLLHPPGGAWIAQFGPYAAKGTHQVSVRVFLEDERRAQELRMAITAKEARIVDVRDELRWEKDPDRRAKFEEELKRLLGKKVALEAELLASRSFVGHDDFSISVGSGSGDFNPFPENGVLKLALPAHVGDVTLSSGGRVRAALDQVLVYVKDEASSAELNALNRFLLDNHAEVSGQNPVNRLLYVKVPVGTDIGALIDRIESRPGVLMAGPNLALSFEMNPKPETFDGDYWFRNVSLPRAWDLAFGATPDPRVSVPICIVDTGITLRDGLDKEFGTIPVVVPVPTLEGQGPDDFPSRPYGHGTTVAAIAAGLGTLGSFESTGVAWGAPILNADVATPNIVIGNEVVTWYSVVDIAIQKCVQTEKARVINASVGAKINPGDSDSSKRDAGKEFRKALFPSIKWLSVQPAPALVVFAAGNDALKTDDELFPPDMPDRALAERIWKRHTLVIGAVDEQDQTASFTRSGQVVDLYAPGVGVGAPVLTRPVSLDAVSGTSFSAPMVAGTAALMLTVNPHLTAAQIKGIMTKTADEVPQFPTPSVIKRLNAYKAVATALAAKTFGDAFVVTQGASWYQGHEDAPTLVISGPATLSRLIGETMRLTPEAALPLMGPVDAFAKITNIALDPIGGHVVLRQEIDLDQAPGLLLHSVKVAVESDREPKPSSLLRTITLQGPIRFSDVKIDPLTDHGFAVRQIGHWQTVSTPEGEGKILVADTTDLVRLDLDTLQMQVVRSFQVPPMSYFPEVRSLTIDFLNRRLLVELSLGSFIVPIPDDGMMPTAGNPLEGEANSGASRAVVESTSESARDVETRIITLRTDPFTGDGYGIRQTHVFTGGPCNGCSNPSERLETFLDPELIYVPSGGAAATDAKVLRTFPGPIDHFIEPGIFSLDLGRGIVFSSQNFNVPPPNFLPGSILYALDLKPGGRYRQVVLPASTSTNTRLLQFSASSIYDQLAPAGPPGN